MNKLNKKTKPRCFQGNTAMKYFVIFVPKNKKCKQKAKNKVKILFSVNYIFLNKISSILF